MRNRTSKTIVTVILAMFFSALAFGANYDYRDMDLGEPAYDPTNGMLVFVTPLPARFSYAPAETTYFRADNTGYMSGKAVADLGTLTLVSLDSSGITSMFPEQYSTEQIRRWIGNPTFLHQLYMQAHNVSAYNKLSNECDMVYDDGNDKSGSMRVQLTCIAKTNDGTFFQNLSYSGGGFNTSTNPAIFKNTNRKFYPGNTIDFYLVTTSAYDPNLVLDNNHRGRLEPNFRDIEKWSYRCNNIGTNRYETAGSGLAGYSPLNADTAINGICYNVKPGTVAQVNWNFFLTPTELATRLDPYTNSAQVIATAELTTDSGIIGNRQFSVAYEFSDTSDPTLGSDFYMRHESNPDGKLMYDLLFTPHGTDPIKKGQQYIWYVGKQADALAQLKVKNLKNAAENLLAGQWSDTIIISITAIEDIYNAST
ncbi:MAG: hypothetical protein PHO72_00910 [Sphaerochaeta sp.]|nr:hypothetical protein [Sphaerochaeta sp.]